MDAAATPNAGRLRHWSKAILTPILLATVAGFLISYAFPARYTSHSLVLVESPKIPDAVVQQVITEDLTQRIATLQQQVLSKTRLQPMLERTSLVKPGQDVYAVIDGIRANMSVEPVVTDLSQIDAKNKRETQSIPIPGFTVNYTGSSAREAEQICNELTSLMLSENYASRQDVAKEITLFLAKQVEDAKQSLDDLDQKLAVLKNQNRHPASSLTIEFDNARKVYQDDLAKQSAVKMSQQAEQQQQGEQMKLLNPANLPDSPDFPNRMLFAGGGLGVGLVFGMSLALWLRYRPKPSG